MMIHCDMADEALIRRQRLRSLKLTPSQLAERLGKQQSYFSDLMNLDGTKSFGEKAARAIEQGLNLPPFWLDGPRAQAPSNDTSSAPPRDLGIVPIDVALRSLGNALAQDLPDDVREDASDMLAKLAQRCGSPRLQADIVALLRPVDVDIHIPPVRVDTNQHTSPNETHDGPAPLMVGGQSRGTEEWDEKRQKHSKPGGQSSATTSMTEGRQHQTKRGAQK